MNYNVYSTYLKDKYKERVYKIPINLPVTCPNRDGEVSKNGCTFCGELGAGLECLPQSLSVKEQLRINIDYIGKRYKAKKFIAYFQNFSNTYLPFDEFKKYMEEAIEENVVELAISTRPDCINDAICTYLETLKNEHNIEITIELGLQTANYHSLVEINRGHTLAEYILASNIIKGHGLLLTTHVILNLPNDNMLDVIETAKVITVCKSDFVKLHGLFIVKNTKMAEEYLSGKISVITSTEYKERVKTFLKYLSKDISVQRLIGRSNEEEALFSNWGRSAWVIKDEIEAELLEENIFQGELCNYLKGRSIEKWYS